MKKVYILMILSILTSCFHKENDKESSDSSLSEESSESIVIDFEDIYTNQQDHGSELGPWSIFFKTIIHNNTDSTLNLNPKSDTIPKALIDELNQIKNIKKIREKVLDYAHYKASQPSSSGDVFILYRNNDTIPLYCKYSPITINGNSQGKYRLYNNSGDIIDLYDNYYQKEFTQFQNFLSDIVQKSTLVFIFNKKDTTFVTPRTELNFYGDPYEEVHWSFW